MKYALFSLLSSTPGLMIMVAMSACTRAGPDPLVEESSSTSVALSATTVQYAYDAAGRLVAVYDPNGSYAQYVYDEAGNILAVNRIGSSALNLVSLLPMTGAVGSAVTLQGSGFGATAANDIVRFNGIAATIRGATAQQIVVTVPASATTGKVTVTVGANTVSSNGNFTVGNGAPAVTGFSPAFADYNSVITVIVSGSGFDSMKGNDALSIGNQFEQVTSATTTQLTSLSFQAQTSGPVRVATAFGSAAAAKDFFVLPPGTTSANVGFSGRVVVDGGSLAITASPNATAFVLFDANPNDNIGVGLTQLNLGGTVSAQAIVTYPDNSLATQFLVTGGTTSELPTLLKRATYLFALQPGPGATAPLQATLFMTRALTGVLVAGSAPTTFASARPGQQATYSFAASAGQRVALTLTGVTFTNGLSVEVIDPNGNLTKSLIASQNQNTTQDLPALMLGRYQVILSPINGGIGQTQLQMVGDASGSAGTIGGNATTLSLATNQHGIYTFAGNANARVGLGVPSMTTSPAGAQVTLTVLDPNGNQLTICTVSGASSCALPILPKTGVYTLAVAPAAGASATLQVLLSQYVTGTVVPNGAAAVFSSSRIGQGGVYSFTATSGQNLSIAGGNCTFPSGVTVTVFDAIGNIIGIVSPAPGFDAVADLVGLKAGTYSISVSPTNGGLGQVALQLVTDASGSAGTVGGNTTTLSLTTNQHGRYTFSGNANAIIGLGFQALSTTPTNGFVLIQVDDAVGNTLKDCSTSTPGSCYLPALPVTGTYTLTVSPPANTSASLQLTLSQYLAGTLTVGGATAVYSTARVGQGAVYRFTTAAVANLTLSLSACTFADGVNVQVLDANGRIVATVTEFKGLTQSLSLPNLSAGTYYVWLIPSDVSVGTMSLGLK